MLVDSNLIIYAASGRYPDLVDWFLNNELSLSIISVVETLGYHKLKTKEKVALQTVFDGMVILQPSAGVFDIATQIRQQRSISLGDALIAATALYHNLSLATHNTKDFKWIENLVLIDPLN